MRFATVFTAVTVAVSAVVAAPQFPGFDIISIIGFDLTVGNKYNAPIPPWGHGSKPGWYYGSNPHNFPQYPCLGGILCKILECFPGVLHCPIPPPPHPPHNPPPPPPSDGYHQTFSNLTGATQAGDYMTFGLVDTVADCKAMCNSVVGCNFVNSYHDVNGKDGSTQLTCSLFTACHDSSDADNRGGQTQPNGSVDFITNSDGWCQN
ncbi:hypothetical protein B0H34DRAFT_75558 [Crassisporium funariophilum]|nr:hypothetical protein B0H34DRAFT_75558 [Crassisporium funariophilum]